MSFVDPQAAARFSPEKMHKQPLYESDRLLCDVYCLLPGQSQRPHVHDDIDKVYLVLSGHPTLILDKEERRLPPGQAAIAAASVPHGVRNDTDEPATLLVCQARTPKGAP